MTSSQDVCILAQNLARSRNWSVFPCKDDKSPAMPGKGGFKHAKTDQFGIAELWRRYPGELVGVATGWRSGIAILDVDLYKPDADKWFSAHQHKLPKTLTAETRQGGIHLIYAHQPGLRCSIGSIAPGVDVKADGGYIISWWCAGFAYLDYRPPEQSQPPWPLWLTPADDKSAMAELRNSWPEQLQVNADEATRSRIEGFVNRILRNVATAPDGTKHDTLLRGARTIGGVITHGGISPGTAQHHLIEALKRNPSAVADWNNAYRTIRDGLTDGLSHPFQLEDRPYGKAA